MRSYEEGETFFIASILKISLQIQQECLIIDTWYRKKLNT